MLLRLKKQALTARQQNLARLINKYWAEQVKADMIAGIHWNTSYNGVNTPQWRADLRFKTKELGDGIQIQYISYGKRRR